MLPFTSCFVSRVDSDTRWLLSVAVAVHIGVEVGDAVHIEVGVGDAVHIEVEVGDAVHIEEEEDKVRGSNCERTGDPTSVILEELAKDNEDVKDSDVPDCGK